MLEIMKFSVKNTVVSLLWWPLCGIAVAGSTSQRDKEEKTSGSKRIGIVPPPPLPHQGIRLIEVERSEADSCCRHVCLYKALCHIFKFIKLLISMWYMERLSEKLSLLFFPTFLLPSLLSLFLFFLLLFPLHSIFFWSFILPFSFHSISFIDLVLFFA